MDAKQFSEDAKKKSASKWIELGLLCASKTPGAGNEGFVRVLVT